MPTRLSALPSPLAVLFDLDGTLTDTTGASSDKISRPTVSRLSVRQPS